MLNWIVLNRTDHLHKMDVALNNLQGLICHKTQQTKPTNHQICIQTFRDEQDATQGRFLSGAKLVWIHSFPSLILVALLRLANPVCPCPGIKLRTRLTADSHPI